MELCNNDPEYANQLVKQINRYMPHLKDTSFRCIPAAILSKTFPRTNQLNRFISIKGTIIKTGAILFKNINDEWVCMKCDEKICGNKIKSIMCESCGSTDIIKKTSYEKASTHQIIRLQDIGNPNTMSDTIEVVLEGDLAGKYTTGQRIIVSGIVALKTGLLKENEDINPTIYIKGLHIEQLDFEMEEDYQNGYLEYFRTKSEFEKRKMLLDFFCSEISGLTHVKLGLLCALVGCGSKPGPRMNCHILLVGDPGMGKTHLMKECMRLVTPSVKVNGIGTSDAGLTVCAVKQGNEWTLEPGALVLADGGICCIDEFTSLRTSDRGGLLEAMEQQTLSVAKAGMVVTLSSRCSIISACNAKSVGDNLSQKISSPLISRFDLIFGIFDQREVEEDIKLTNKILGRGNIIDKSDISDLSKWTHSTLKHYLGVAKQIQVNTNEEVNEIISKYFYYKKRNDKEITIRMLEGIIRLASSLSKLVCSDAISIESAYCAILLVECCLNMKRLVDFDPERVFNDEEEFNSTILKLRDILKINKK
ncbi:putative DNA helicase MCM9 [Astathelohania contejeani]|uniref:DNA helicase n=1 Tax=Astathelohania contejeani TaxID=164912 RepID=A0ABQ7I081_9MICR|nr:putative DNA helicase MCM9 [Thelohania contejeani]